MLPSSSLHKRLCARGKQNNEGYTRISRGRAAQLEESLDPFEDGALLSEGKPTGHLYDITNATGPKSGVLTSIDRDIIL